MNLFNNFKNMYLILPIFGYLSAYYLIKILIPILKKYFLDLPNSRSSHEKPIPRGGGLIFPVQSIIISFISGDFLSLICLPLALIGFLDDRYNLSSFFRFLIQILTALLIIFYSPFLFDNLQNFGAINIIIIPFLILTFTGFINFINFMDGIDGLVASCFLFGFLFLGFENDPFIFIFVGTLGAFLKWNWNPAKVFMGDVGSTFLAAYFLINLLKINSLTNIISLFLILSPLTIDSFSCVVRRYFQGQNIFKPHKLHLYQRLCKSGLSHSKVTIIYASSSLSLGLIYNMFGIYSLVVMIMILVLFGLWLNKNIAAPFKNDL